MAAIITNRVVTILFLVWVELSDTGGATEYLEYNCGRSITSAGGRLESQVCPTYSNDVDCSVILEAPSEEHQFILQYDYIELQPYGSLFCADYIEILDGDNYTSTLLRACSSDTVDGYYQLSTSDKLMVRMVTNGIITNSGFSLTFTAVIINSSDCTDQGMFDCGNDYCISNNQTCNGINDCVNNQDEILDSGSTCSVIGPDTNKHCDFVTSVAGVNVYYLEDDCDETITDIGGRLQSQRYETYQNNFQCDVILAAPSVEYQLIIQYDYIDMEWFDSTSCVDYMEIRDGQSYGSSVLLTACKTDTVYGYYHLSTTDKVMVRMVTDERITKRGFSITFTAVKVNSICTDQGMFDCGNDYCISEDLSCDGIDNCVNNQDETIGWNTCDVVGPDTNKPDRDSGTHTEAAALTSIIISVVTTCWQRLHGGFV